VEGEAVVPIWERIVHSCDQASAACEDGNLDGRFTALMRAQKDLDQFEAVMERALRPGEGEELLLMDGFLRSLVETANLTGEGRYARCATDLARYVGTLWDRVLLPTVAQ